MLGGGRDTLPEAVVALAFAGAQLRFGISDGAPACLYVCWVEGRLSRGIATSGCWFRLLKCEEGP